MFNCSNNNIIILILILIFCILYCVYEINNLKKSLTNKVENFTTQDDINTAVKKIYLADVEAIRLLSNFAIQLSQGGFTIPGNLSISGHLNTTGNLSLTLGQFISLGRNTEKGGDYKSCTIGSGIADSNALCILGEGPEGSRITRIVDHLNISKGLGTGSDAHIGGDLSVAGSLIRIGTGRGTNNEGCIHYNGSQIILTRQKPDGGWDWDNNSLKFQVDTGTLYVKNIVCHNIITNT